MKFLMACLALLGMTGGVSLAQDSAWPMKWVTDSQPLLAQANRLAAALKIMGQPLSPAMLSQPQHDHRIKAAVWVCASIDRVLATRYVSLTVKE